MAHRFADQIDKFRGARREFERIKRHLRHVRLFRRVAEATMRDGSPRAHTAAHRAYMQVIEADPTAN
jgi:hypothetical protein